MTERTNGLVSPAQMDTTKYPPGGQKEECPHTDELRAIKAATERMEAKMAEFIEDAIRKVLGQ